jgi:hypothetical protein
MTLQDYHNVVRFDKINTSNEKLKGTMRHVSSTLNFLDNVGVNWGRTYNDKEMDKTRRGSDT